MKRVEEGQTSYYRSVLTDSNGVQLTTANIATMLVTLYERYSKDIINVRDKQDVRNSGSWDKGVSFLAPDANGVVKLEFRLTTLDNIMTSASVGGSEIHVILFEGTTAGAPSDTYKHRVEYEVINDLKS